MKKPQDYLLNNNRMIQIIFAILIIILIIILMVQVFDIDEQEKFEDELAINKEVVSSTEPLKPITQVIDDINNEMKDIRQVNVY